MNTTEFVDQIAETAGLPRSTVRSVLNASFDLVLTTVTRGDAVKLHGFGSFVRSWRSRSAVRSPATRRKMMVGGRHTVRFRPSKRFKDSLLALSGQEWRSEEHQSAWRLAEVLVGDLDLYASRKPAIRAKTSAEGVDATCSRSLGEDWSRAKATYREKVDVKVDMEAAYLTEAARRTWKI